MGYDKANGRYVRLRHTNREYETYYLHFSRFARGLKVGQRVRQGEVLGYVGATGYATGPHLDFRVKKGGQFVNPRTLKLPPADPVPDAELASFRILCLAHDAALKELGTVRGEPVVVTALEPGSAPPSWQNVLQPGGAALPPLLDAAN
jgi:murein DD-endopeptidase MepM/ murein hydrolase activator NlpD